MKTSAAEILKSLRNESPMGFAVPMLVMTQELHIAVSTDDVFAVIHEELESE